MRNSNGTFQVGHDLCIKHGCYKTKTYRSWQAMKMRCYNENHKAYKNYGGRGIKVCDRWLKFENFLADMGERPEGKTLERIDGDKNYEPSNCKWSDRFEQNNNTSRNSFLTYLGQTKTKAQWAKEYGVKYNNFLHRLRRGWSIERALNEQ